MTLWQKFLKWITPEWWWKQNRPLTTGEEQSLQALLEFVIYVKVTSLDGSPIELTDEIREMVRDVSDRCVGQTYPTRIPMVTLDNRLRRLMNQLKEGGGVSPNDGNLSVLQMMLTTYS